MLNKKVKIILSMLFAVLVIAFPLLPLKIPYLTVAVMVFAGINVITVIGLNLLMGYAGQVSLGQAGFFGLGAYITAVLTVKYNLGVWLSILIALALTAVIAYIIAIPALKLKGHYLALATLGFGMIVYTLLKEGNELTGSSSEMAGIPGLHFWNWDFSSDTHYYYFVWGVVAILIYISYRIVNSRVGRALRAIHDSELAASALGVNTSTYKIQVFTLSAVFAAIAGSIYAPYVSFISPVIIDLKNSIEFVTMAVVGGIASSAGPLVGSLLITMLMEGLKLFPDYDIVLFGLILVLVMIYAPNGLVGWFNDMLRKSANLAKPKAKETKQTVSAGKD